MMSGTQVAGERVIDIDTYAEDIDRLLKIMLSITYKACRNIKASGRMRNKVYVICNIYRIIKRIIRDRNADYITPFDKLMLILFHLSDNMYKDILEINEIIFSYLDENQRNEIEEILRRLKENSRHNDISLLKVFLSKDIEGIMSLMDPDRSLLHRINFFAEEKLGVRNHVAVYKGRYRGEEAIAKVIHIDEIPEYERKEYLKSYINSINLWKDCTKECHLPEILFSDIRGDKLIVIYKYVRGEVLGRSVIARGDIVRNVAWIAVNVLETLDCVYRRGALHTDIKENNIIYTGKKAVLIDWINITRINERGLVDPIYPYCQRDYIEMVQQALGGQELKLEIINVLKEICSLMQVIYKLYHGKEYSADMTLPSSIHIENYLNRLFRNILITVNKECIRKIVSQISNDIDSREYGKKMRTSVFNELKKIFEAIAKNKNLEKKKDINLISCITEI